MNRRNILGTGIDDGRMSDFVSSALGHIEQRDGAYAVTPNSEIVLGAMRDSGLRAALDGAALSLPDSAGIMLSSKILGCGFPEKVPGIDFAFGLLASLAERKGSVYIFGGAEGIARRAAEEILRRYPGITVCGTCCGFGYDDKALCESISSASPDFLMVCLGSPKQELWMRSHAGTVDAGLMAGLGGTADVLAGEAELAPQRWRDAGFEWLFRLIRQPSRIRRVARLPLILIFALLYRLGGKPDGQR